MEPTLAELMKPDRIQKQAKYENALRAVTMAYQYAKELAYLSDVEIRGADGKISGYQEHPVEAKVANLTKVARLLIPDIEHDLNETLKRLD